MFYRKDKVKILLVNYHRKTLKLNKNSNITQTTNNRNELQQHSTEYNVHKHNT